MNFSKKVFSLFVFILAVSLIVDAIKIKAEQTQEYGNPNIQQEVLGFQTLNDIPEIGYIIKDKETLHLTNDIINNDEKFKLLLQFIKNNFRLEILKIDASDTDITNEQLTTLLYQGNIRNTLERLDLFFCNHINWDTVNIGNLKQLQHLDLSYTTITSQQLTALLNQGNIRNTLQWLDFSSCDHINWDIVNIETLKQLNILFIDETSITSHQLTALLNQGNIRNTLQWLDLSSCDHINWDIVNIETLKQLNILFLGEITITSHQLTALLNQGNIRNTLQLLDLSRCNHINWDTVNLKNIQQLQHLNLSYATITSQQLTTLLDQGNIRNTLKRLDLSSCNNINWDTVNIGNLKQLKILLLDETTITSHQLTALLNQGNIRNTLQWLDFSSCDHINWDTVNIENLKQLKILFLDEITITSHQLTALLNQGNIRNTLQWLDFSSCNDINWDIVNIGNLKQLEYLSLNYSTITSQQLTTLLDQRNIRNTLKLLDLSSCNNINWDTVNIGNLKQLEILFLNEITITPPQLANLLNQGNIKNTLKLLDLSFCNDINWDTVNNEDTVTRLDPIHNNLLPSRYFS